MNSTYKRLEQNELSMCEETLTKAFKEEPWNDNWNFEQT